MLVKVYFKRTGDAREVTAVGQLEIGQKGDLLPEDFPPDEKCGKWSEAVDERHEAASSGKTIRM